MALLPIQVKRLQALSLRDQMIRLLMAHHRLTMVLLPQMIVTAATIPRVILKVEWSNRSHRF
jgi:hypothetical protein